MYYLFELSVIRRGKDPVDSDNQTNSVYCLDCLDCNDSYAGESKRALSVRIGEHKRANKNVILKQPFHYICFIINTNLNLVTTRQKCWTLNHNIIEG